MNFFKKLLAPLLMISALSGCASQSEDMVSIGKAAFKGYGCVTCHKVGGQGGILGPDLTFVGFRKTPEWLDRWLKDPHAWKKNTLMPNFYFNDRMRLALVSYLSSLQGEGYREGTAPWDDPSLKDNPVKRGEMIYLSVGCTGCHGWRGEGGYPNNNVAGDQIPSLKLVADGYSKDELKMKIKKGSHPAKRDLTAENPLIYMPTWGEKLKDDELSDLVEYLYSLRPPKPATEEW